MIILIVGETCHDIFIYGDVNRLCPEAPVPILVPKKTITTSGMAGNVYNNVKSINNSANIHFLRQDCVITKTRYVDEKTNHLIVRVDEGENNVKPLDISPIDLSVYDIIIVSDYNKGFISDDTLIEIGLRSKGLKIIDSKRRLRKDIVEVFDFVKVNEKEFENNKILLSNYPEKTIITMGQKGVKYNNEIIPSPKPMETIDVSGAGDTFTAAFTIKYYKTKDIKISLKYANELSAIVVSKRGVVTPF